MKWFCPFPGGDGRGASSGFTLIEMLVTLTAFSIVLASLAAGLHAGARTWRAIAREQQRVERYAAARRLIEEDLRAVCRVAAATPPLALTVGDAGEPVLSLTLLAGRRRLVQEHAFTAAHVRYALRADEGGGHPALMRTVVPVVGGETPLDDTSEAVVLEEVAGLAIQILNDGHYADAWERQEPPMGVVLDATMADGRTLATSALVGIAAGEAR